jgi:hypothetical protein
MGNTPSEPEWNADERATEGRMEGRWRVLFGRWYGNKMSPWLYWHFDGALPRFSESWHSAASCRSLQCNVGLSGFIALKNVLMTSAARGLASLGILRRIADRSRSSFLNPMGSSAFGFNFILPRRIVRK